MATLAGARRGVVAAKVGVWLVALAPTAWLVAALFGRTLGVNPTETIILVEGRWALGFLIATLAVTPLRRLLRWNRIIQFRRLLGLFAFFHACVHVVAYVGLDHLFDLSVIVEDVLERRYITAGFASLVLMVPLAVTSTKGWIRRLGRRWRRLHRLAYVAAALGVLHFYWKVRADTFWPLVATAILGSLLAARLIHWRRARMMRKGAGG